MPTYDYECDRCRTVFEAFHAASAPSPECPECGGLSTKHFMSAPAIHGDAAQGREQAVRSLPQCGKGCSCCP